MSAEKVGPTPGPWYVDKGASNSSDEFGHLGTVRGGPGNYNLVTVWADVGELADHAEANARLIASAPDLLALAKRYASECAWCSGTGTIEHVPFDNGVSSTSKCIQCADIRAVIDKAEGGA